MAASNTKECFRECVGKKVVGVLFDAMPSGHRDLSRGTKTLLFDDGSGLQSPRMGRFGLNTPRKSNEQSARPTAIFVAINAISKTCSTLPVLFCLRL